ncbi:MAG: PKD domain-containing protein [Succinivibrionaceae bacterium]
MNLQISKSKFKILFLLPIIFLSLNGCSDPDSREIEETVVKNGQVHTIDPKTKLERMTNSPFAYNTVHAYIGEDYKEEIYTPTGEKMIEIPIVVLNGYIVKATICADFDYNYECDPNIEQVITNNNGYAVMKVRESIYNSFLTHNVIVTIKEYQSANKVDNQILSFDFSFVMFGDTTKNHINFITPFNTLAMAYTENGSVISKSNALMAMAVALDIKNYRYLNQDYNKLNKIILIAGELLVQGQLLPKSLNDINGNLINLNDLLELLRVISSKSKFLLKQGYSISETIDILKNELFETDKQTSRPYANFYPEIRFLKAKFVNKSYDFSSDKVYYRWDFGNGKFSTLKNGYTSYDKPGTYTVKLSVSNNDYEVSIAKDITISATERCVPITPSFYCYNQEDDFFCQTENFDTTMCSELRNSLPNDLKYYWYVNGKLKSKGFYINIPKEPLINFIKRKRNSKGHAPVRSSLEHNIYSEQYNQQKNIDRVSFNVELIVTNGKNSLKTKQTITFKPENE